MAWYENSLARAFPDKSRVLGIADRLLEERNEVRRALLARNLSFPAGRAVVHELIHRSAACRLTDLKAADAWVERAVEVAHCFSPDKLSPGLVQDLRAEACAHQANVRRLQGRFSEAEEWWRRAEKALNLGTGDLELSAHLRAMKGSLVRAQGRLEDAAALLIEAARIFEEELDDLHGAGRVLIKLSGVRFLQGKPDEGLQLTLRAGRWIESRREPELASIVAANLALFSGEAMDPDAGLEVIAKFRTFLDDTIPEPPRLRVAWMEGLLLARRGEHRAAVRYLQEVYESFLRLGLIYDAILASLDQALIHLRENRYHYVRELSDDVRLLFSEPSVPPLAGEALRGYDRAVRAGKVTEESLERLIRDLHLRLAPPQHRTRFALPTASPQSALELDSAG